MLFLMYLSVCRWVCTLRTLAQPNPEMGTKSVYHRAAHLNHGLQDNFTPALVPGDRSQNAIVRREHTAC